MEAEKTELKPELYAAAPAALHRTLAQSQTFRQAAKVSKQLRWTQARGRKLSFLIQFEYDYKTSVDVYHKLKRK